MMRFRRDDLRKFAQRDWGAPERLARRQRARRPIAQKIAMAVELYESARAARPGWPSDDDRQRDLEAHIELRAKLARAAHVGSR